MKWEQENLLLKFTNLYLAHGTRQPTSLYRSSAPFYGTEYEIWAGFGPVVRLLTENFDIYIMALPVTNPKSTNPKFSQNLFFLFQMYGEKTEEAEELRLDLLDVKEMYKMQIEDLLRKQKS